MHVLALHIPPWSDVCIQGQYTKCGAAFDETFLFSNDRGNDSMPMMQE
jgi:hypothetical protein